jgi:hypothetical protein
MASPELLLFFYAHFSWDTRQKSPKFSVFSSFLCVLCVKFFQSRIRKSITTEDAEKIGDHGELSLAEDYVQTLAPIFGQCNPRDFDLRG